MPQPPLPPAAPANLRSRLVALLGPRGSGRRVLVVNGLWETSSFVLQAAVMFFLSPFIVARLGTAPYGVWEIVVALTGYLSFADLGVRPAAVHFIARHNARGDVEALNRYVNTAWVLFAAAGVAIVLLSVPLALVLPRFWHLTEGHATSAAIALLVVAVQMAVTLPLNAFSAVLVGKQRYDLLARARLVMLALKTAAIVLVLSHGGGLVALAVAVATSAIVEMGAYTAIAFRAERRLVFDPRRVSRDALRALLRFGGWATVVSIALQITWATDPLVIGYALSTTAVAWYAVGFKLAYYARDLLRVAARVVEPAAGALQALEDREGILRMLTRSVRLMLLCAGPVAVFLLVAGRPFLLRWMGPEFAERSAIVLDVIMAAVVPAIASGPLIAAHFGMGRVRPLALLLLLEAGLNLSLSVLLVGPLGLLGVALGTALPAGLVHGVLLPLLLCRQHGLSLVRWWRATWLGPVLAALPTAAALRLVVSPDAALGYPALFLLAAATAGLYFGVALIIRRLAPGVFEGTA